ncbi:MAG: M15 family metallopeptidase [Pseudomonadota bacterium]
MTSWTLAASDLLKLHGVNPAIVRVLMRAARDGAPRFAVIEGTRTVARQRELVARGASKTMRSRHIHGFAVDIAPVIAGKISWDWPAYYPLAKAIKAAAAAEGVALTWGGDWRKFKDGPHWELPHATYPDPK